jgi:hypothetical protein
MARNYFEKCFDFTVFLGILLSKLLYLFAFILS